MLVWIMETCDMVHAMQYQAMCRKDEESNILANGDDAMKENQTLMLMTVRGKPIVKGVNPEEKCPTGFKPLVRDHVGNVAMGYLDKVFAQLREDEYTWCTNHPLVLQQLQALMTEAQAQLGRLQDQSERQKLLLETSRV